MDSKDVNLTLIQSYVRKFTGQLTVSTKFTANTDVILTVICLGLELKRGLLGPRSYYLVVSLKFLYLRCKATHLLLKNTDVDKVEFYWPVISIGLQSYPILTLYCYIGSKACSNCYICGLLDKNLGRPLWNIIYTKVDLSIIFRSVSFRNGNR